MRHMLRVTCTPIPSFGAKTGRSKESSRRRPRPNYKNRKNGLKIFPEFLQNDLKISGFTSKNPIKTPKNL